MGYVTLSVFVLSTLLAPMPTPRTRVESHYDEHFHIFEEYENSDSPELIRKKLDALAAQLEADPQYETLLLSYAGKVACRSEAIERAQGVKRYLLSKGIAPKRIRIANGGFRDDWSVELWLNIRGMRGPKPNPHLRRAQVRILKRVGKDRAKCPGDYKIE